MQGSNLKNLSMFQGLCGQEAFKNVVLTTTMWDNLPLYDEGVARERQLVNTKEWWGQMCEQGSKTLRHDGGRDSALAIVAELVKSSGPAVLQIQREMVDEHKDLENTAAGQEVEKDIQEASRTLRTRMREVAEEHRQAMKTKDHDLVEVSQRQLSIWDAQLQQAAKDEASLKASLERLEKDKEAEIRALLIRLDSQERDFRELLAQQDAELARTRAVRQKDIEEYRKLQAQHDQEIREFRRELSELDKEHQTAEAAEQSYRERGSSAANQQDAELARTRAVRQKDIGEYREPQAKHDQESRKFRRDVSELDKEHQTMKDAEQPYRESGSSAAKRARREVARLQKLKADAQQDFLMRQERAAREERQLQVKFKETQEVGKKRKRAMKALQVLTILAGLGITIAGMATTNPVLAVAGAGIIAMPAGMKSRKKTPLAFEVSNPTTKHGRKLGRFV